MELGEPVQPPSQALPAHEDAVDRIIASVMINGQGPFRFMLDTGASQTAVTMSVLERLDLPRNDAARIPVIGVSGSRLVTSVHVTHLDAGALHLANVDLPVLTGPVFQGIDGILGMDGLQGKKLTADFLSGSFTISQSHNLRARSDYSILPVHFLSQRLLMVDGQVGHVNTKAIIDTGGERTIGNLALLRALARRHDAGIYGGQTGVLDATDNSQPGQIGMIWDARFGEATVNNLVVIFGDFPVFKSWQLNDQPALLIGMDVLGTLANLSIDYRRREVQIKPRSVPMLTLRRVRQP